MALINTAETISCYWLGQVTIKQLERFLWVLEKCSLWSLPPSEETEKNMSLIRPQLTRPLPWVIFLPTLLMLRMWRETVSLTTVITGGERYTAAQMVRNIQNTRRTLRAVKYHGIRYRRMQKQITASENESNESEKVNNWSNLFSRAMCFKRVGSKEIVEPIKVKESEQVKPEDEPKIEKENTRKRQLSVDNASDKGINDEDEEWEDDEEEEGNFNPDDALRELATKVEELDTDTEDSDYSGSEDDLDTSGYSISPEEGEEIEVTELIMEEADKEQQTEDIQKEKKPVEDLKTKVHDQQKEKKPVEDLKIKVDDQQKGKSKDAGIKATKKTTQKDNQKENLNTKDSESTKKDMKSDLSSKTNVNNQKKVEPKIETQKDAEQKSPEETSIKNVKDETKINEKEKSHSLKNDKTDASTIKANEDNKCVNVESKKEGNRKEYRNVSQADNTVNKNPSVPKLKAQEANLLKEFPENKSDHNKKLTQEGGDGGKKNLKSNLETSSELFLQAEKLFSSNTEKANSKQSDSTHAPNKQQTSVRERAHLKTRKKKNNTPVVNATSTSDRNNFNNNICKMKVNTGKKTSESQIIQ